MNDSTLEFQFKAIQNYIRTEIFPFCLALAYANGQHNKAVFSYLEDLEKIDWKLPDLTDHYTTNSNRYWNALESSDASHDLLPYFKTLLLLYEGKSTYAHHYISLIYNLCPPHESMQHLLDRVVALSGIYRSVESEWSKNIDHVKRGGDVNKEIQECTDILAFNPNSEKALSNLIEMNANSKVNPHFKYKDYQDQLISTNPMSASLTVISTKEAAYEQYLRKETINYFVDPYHFDQNFYDFAEVALSLKKYDIAADAIHLIRSNNRINELNLFNTEIYYDYALYKLGLEINTELKSFNRKKFANSNESTVNCVYKKRNTLHTLISKTKFMSRIILLLFLFTVTFAAISQTVHVTEQTDLSGDVNESSGLLLLEDRLITHNDSGDDPTLYELNTENGTVIRTVTVANASSVDWEDICADETYIYIGDFGNNSGSREDLAIFRVAIDDYLTTSNDTVFADTIAFNYADQTSFDPAPLATNYDAEAMIAYNDSIYLFTKNWSTLRPMSTQFQKFRRLFGFH